MKTSRHYLYIAVAAVTIFGCGAPPNNEISAKAPAAPLPTMAKAAADEATPAQSTFANLTTPVPPSIQSRRIIRSVDLRIRVPNTEKAERTIKQIIARAEGYEESAESGSMADVSPVSTLHLRVPVDRFEECIDQVEKLGVRLSKNVASEDVTEKVVDMDARLRTMAVQEETYRQILRQTTKIHDTIEIQDRLANLRGEIESIQSQRKSLASSAAYSRMNVIIEQDAAMTTAPGDPNWFGQSWAQATTALGNVTRGAISGAIWLVVFSPFVLLAILGVRQFVRTRRRPNRPPVSAVYLADGVSTKIP